MIQWYFKKKQFHKVVQKLKNKNISSLKRNFKKIICLHVPYFSTAKTEPLIASYFPFSNRTPVVLMRIPLTGLVKHLATLEIKI